MTEKSGGSWWKWILIIAVIAAATGGGYFYFSHGRTQLVSYNAAAVARGELTKLVTATGTLNPMVNVTVGSQVSGRISKLNVDFNSAVTKGETLAVIDPAIYQPPVAPPSPDLANAQ